MEAVEYHVVRGDTFWGLAERFYGNGSLYPIIQQYNGTEHLHAGDVIYIPSPELAQSLQQQQQPQRQQPQRQQRSSSNNHSSMNMNNFRMQVMLSGLGYDTHGIDGIIGRNTQNALIRFQNDYGIYASGNADQATINAMHHAFMNGEIYLTERVLQAMLYNAGFNPGKIDGVWGRNTQNALENFQAHYGLSVSGEADYDTIVTLKSALYPNDAY